MAGLSFKNAAGTFKTDVVVPEPTANTTVTMTTVPTDAEYLAGLPVLVV